MEKKTLNVMEIVDGTSTNAQAAPLFLEMDRSIIENKIIVLSLKNCSPVSSSFLNSSIGALVEKYGLNALKGRLLIKDYTPALANAFKKYLSDLEQLQG